MEGGSDDDDDDDTDEDLGEVVVVEMVEVPRSAAEETAANRESRPNITAKERG